MVLSLISLFLWEIGITMALRIKELCKERHVTMAEIAAQLGINPITLSQSLNGNPTLSRLNQVAEVLHVDVSELFERTDDNRIHGVLYVGGKPVIVNSRDEIEKVLKISSE